MVLLGLCSESLLCMMLLNTMCKVILRHTNIPTLILVHMAVFRPSSAHGYWEQMVENAVRMH